MKSTKRTQFVSQESMRSVVNNTYEAVMVTAMEARRINLRDRMLGIEEDRTDKVTTIALDKLLNEELHFAYQAKEEEE